jgi:hypothetical protein
MVMVSARLTRRWRLSYRHDLPVGGPCRIPEELIPRAGVWLDPELPHV